MIVKKLRIESNSPSSSCLIHLRDWECAVAIIETNSPLVRLFEVRPSSTVGLNDGLAHICTESSCEAQIRFFFQLSSNAIDVAIQPFDRRFVVLKFDAEIREEQ